MSDSYCQTDLALIIAQKPSSLVLYQHSSANIAILMHTYLTFRIPAMEYSHPAMISTNSASKQQFLLGKMQFPIKAQWILGYLNANVLRQ